MDEQEMEIKIEVLEEEVKELRKEIEYLKGYIAGLSYTPVRPDPSYPPYRPPVIFC